MEPIENSEYGETTDYTTKPSVTSNVDFCNENSDTYTDMPNVGHAIQVYWPLDNIYYEGRVSAFNNDTNIHAIAYSDGDCEELNLQHETWRYGDDNVINASTASLGKHNLESISQ